jgi:hypothetical protein
MKPQALTHKLLQSIRKYSNYLSALEQGVSPDDVKQSIISILAPYFENAQVLDELAIIVLAPEAVSVSKLQHDKWALDMFSNVLEDYRKALAINKKHCLDTCARWEEKIGHGTSEYVSSFLLEVDKEELPLREFRYEVFRNIGGIIEASIQPLLRELLIQVRLRRGKTNPDAGVDTMDLGLVVGELFDTSGYPELFAPPPWNIRLNQWRNMAQHHKTRVEKMEIIGTYGIGSNEHEVRFTRGELFNALMKIHSVLAAVRTARSLFYIDNIEEMRLRVTKTDVRPEQLMFQMAVSFATQGYELQEFSQDEDSVNAVLVDVTESPTRIRLAHFSQFVFPIWRYFPSKIISAQLLDKNGTLLLTVTARGEDCEAVSKGEIQFSTLAERVDFILTNEGKNIPALAE